MRLGISSYTYVWSVGVPGYPQPQQPLTAEGLLEKATELGVGVVQIADNLPLDRLNAKELDRLASRAAERDIRLEVGTSGIVPDHLRTYLALAVKLRSSLVRVVIDTDSSQPTPDEIVTSLHEILPAFSRAEIWLALENHDRFTAASLAQIIERCRGHKLGICLDTANSIGCGEDLSTLLRTLGPWIVNVHVKDYCARRLPHKKGFFVEGCPAGSGILDIPQLLADVSRFGHDPNAILELWPPPESTIEGSIAKEEAWTRDSIRYLRQFISE
jgi:sugar phosphate isomerase/epimerase